MNSNLWNERRQCWPFDHHHGPYLNNSQFSYTHRGLVKWSACLPSTPTIWVRILLTPPIFSVKFVVETNENKEEKRPGLAHFKKVFKLKQIFTIDWLIQNVDSWVEVDGRNIPERLLEVVHHLQGLRRQKMSIQYTVLGFEPMTFGTWVSSHYHWTRAPALFVYTTPRAA